jgi:multidrug efflux pump subunit AcrB
MIARFFIDRPIFATVLSVLITLIGGISLASLPVAQYPRITPPGVVISISYPGASAQVVADTVAAPIEQQVNGVENMLYMSSQSGNDGSYSLTVTFDIGTDLKTSLVKVQNRVTLAMPQLPTQVQNQGITIRKKTPDQLLIVNFFSRDGSWSDLDLSNYATIYVKDELLRVDGVSDITYQGQRDYSIRAWLDPQRLAAHNLTAMDVSKAIANQNIDAPAGQMGGAPALKSVSRQSPINTLGRLRTTEEFGNIIVAANLGQLGPANNGTTLPASTGFGATGSSSTNVPFIPLGATTASDNAATIGTSTVGPTAPLADTSSSTTTMTGTTTVTTDATTGATVTNAPLAGATVTGSSGTSASQMVGGSGNAGSVNPATAIVRLRDVARLELGALNYNMACTFDGMPSVGLNLYQLPGTNALDVGDRVRKKMRELKKRFPAGVDYDIGYDTTPFIEESVNDVFITLLQAVGLVGIVVLVFLQDWRAMILPMIDVPVSIIGTFAVMALLGFSLNNISLFGLVLAIGIVVDDAIVVLENIERFVAKGFDARTATIKAMEEVTGPIMAVSLVLCAVFVPCAFLGGITGQFFRQFAVTISVSTVISAINAITMTPSRAVLIFKANEARGHHRREALPWWSVGVLTGGLAVWFGHQWVINWFSLSAAISDEDNGKWVNRAVMAGEFLVGSVPGLVAGWFLIWPVNAVLGWLFRGFNRLFDGMTVVYGWVVGLSMRTSVLVLLFYGLLIFLTYVLYAGIPTKWLELARLPPDVIKFIEEKCPAPTGFIPEQDQGRLIVSIQLPDSASLQRTMETAAQVEAITRADTPGVRHTVTFSGISFLLQANSPNFASMFVVLDSFEYRRTKLKELPDYDLSVLSPLKDRADIPKTGQSQTFVVEVAGKLFFRSFDAQGKLVVNSDEEKLRGKGGQIQRLRTRLQDLWPPHELSAGEKSEIKQAVSSLVSETMTQQGIMASLDMDWGRDARDAKVDVFPSSPVPGIGTAGGYKVMVQDLKAIGVNSLEAETTNLARELNKPGLGLSNGRTLFRARTPQLYLDIDRVKAAKLGVALDDVNQTLDIYLGSQDVNNYNDFGRDWQVTIQAEGDFRNDINKVNLLQVRNSSGGMVPVTTLMKSWPPKEQGGPIAITRYNLAQAAAINGRINQGTSTGEAIDHINEIAKDSLPSSMKKEWTELMFLQIQAGQKGYAMFLLGIMFVFLALAALYESWTLPLAVILVVPLCVLCSVVGVLMTNRDVNIFVQIGLLVLVGLACKNAILIVEYARQLHLEGGRTTYEATKEASKLRLRPILMTSFAFIFGVVPLMVAAGAGAEMRQSLGTAVFSGMLGVTLFGIFLTPVFFFVIQRVGETRLFTHPVTQWVVSCVLGLVCGLAGGYGLAEINVVNLETGLLLGSVAGVLAVIAVRGLHLGLRVTRARYYIPKETV